MSLNNTMTFEYLRSTNNFTEWDLFIKTTIRGHFSTYSTYLSSFEPYGASYEIITAVIDKKIVGGIGLIIFGKGPFKLVSAISGPVVEVGHEELYFRLLYQGRQFAESIGAFLFQFSTLSHAKYDKPYLLADLDFSLELDLHKGLPFKMTPIPQLLFLIDLQPYQNGKSWEENMLASFDRHARRRIKKSMEHPLEFVEATTDNEIQKAYQLFVNNGKTQGYSTRTWEDFGHIILKQIINQEARVFNVIINGEIICSHYGIIAGKRYFYILGGTKRTETDYSVGHFMHWNIMKVAHEMKLEAYDLGARGTSGVFRFKKSFKPKYIPFDPPKYYILSHFKFYLMNKLFPYFKKYKVQFSYLAKKFI